MKEKLARLSGRIPVRIPLSVFLPVSVFYMELVLKLGNQTPVSAASILYILLFSLSMGLLLSLIGSLLVRTRLCGIVTGLLLALLCIFFCVEYFCKIFFNTYMSLESIFVGAGGVLTDFAGTIIGLIISGLGMIFLFLLPWLLYLFLTATDHIRWPGSSVRGRLLLLTGSLILFAAGFLSVHSSDTAKLRYAATYEYDLSVSGFGLITGTRLDLQYWIFGNEAAAQFVGVTQEDFAEADADTSEASADTVTAADTDTTAYNILDIDFSALAEEESDPVIAAIDSYVASLTASEKNACTGLFEGKNLILICAEAFSAEVIDEELTPTLYRLATCGIQFTNYYQPAWGGSTSSGEFSVFTGLVPTDGANSIQHTIGSNMYFTLGNQLQRLSYTSFAFHNHSYSYYNRNLTHENMGYSTFLARGNGLEDLITEQWPESDLELMEATLDLYIDEQPFSIYYMTVSGHANYSWSANEMSAKNRQTVEALYPDASEGVQAYLAANLELEYALAYLVERLEEAGIADDTVIVLTADHYPYGLESSSASGWSNGLAELYGYEYSDPWERDHSALIIWSGCLEDMDPIIVDTPVSSLDIVPTLSNLMGLDYDSRLLAGRDVFSDEEAIILWANYSWLTQKAAYNSLTDTYTIFEGYEDTVDDAYLERISAIVRNKITLSRNIIDTDYYETLFGDD